MRRRVPALHTGPPSADVGLQRIGPQKMVSSSSQGPRLFLSGSQHTHKTAFNAGSKRSDLGCSQYIARPRLAVSGYVLSAVIWCQGIAERVDSAGSLMAHVLVRGLARALSTVASGKVQA